MSFALGLALGLVIAWRFFREVVCTECECRCDPDERYAADHEDCEFPCLIAGCDPDRSERAEDVQ